MRFELDLAGGQPYHSLLTAAHKAGVVVYCFEMWAESCLLSNSIKFPVNSDSSRRQSPSGELLRQLVLDDGRVELHDSSRAMHPAHSVAEEAPKQAKDTKEEDVERNDSVATSRRLLPRAAVTYVSSLDHVDCGRFVGSEGLSRVVMSSNAHNATSVTLSSASDTTPTTDSTERVSTSPSTANGDRSAAVTPPPGASTSNPSGNENGDGSATGASGANNDNSTVQPAVPFTATSLFGRHGIYPFSPDTNNMYPYASTPSSASSSTGENSGAAGRSSEPAT